MKKEFLAFVYLVMYFNALGQVRKISTESKNQITRWHKGEIIFIGGEKVTSDSIQFNEFNSNLLVRGLDDVNALLPDRVSEFSFFDTSNSQKRSFVSLKVPVDEKLDEHDRVKSIDLNTEVSSKRSVPYFFEILISTNNFSLLSKIIPADNYVVSRISLGLGLPKQTNPTINMLNSTSGGQFVERFSIFFLDSQGHLYPYGVFTKRWGTLNDDFSAKLVQGDKPIKYFFADRFDEVMQYGSANNLSIKSKKDLVHLIEYYKFIAKN